MEQLQDKKPDEAELIPSALLFDCDGTLLLTSDLHFTAISQAIERQGAHIPRDWYMALTGLGRADLFAAYMRDFGVHLDLPRAIEDSISATIALAPLAHENPAVAAIAREVSGRLPIAVVTNCEATIATALLREVGLLHLFNALFGCESAPRPKPAPDLYLAAAARLGISPADCLVFEDSDQGILAAKAAEMRCIDVRDPEWPIQCLGLHACLVQAPEVGLST
jgi:beta-phosphoglucomutase-like phosphatase (HAD superfamily)